MSIKVDQWATFADYVENHIKHYVVPQYGDGDDIANDYTFEDCVTNMKRYLARAGRNSREFQDHLDMLKIAHYAQMAYFKLGEQHAKK